MQERRTRAIQRLVRLNESILYWTFAQRLPRGVCGIVAALCAHQEAEPWDLQAGQLGISYDQRCDEVMRLRRAAISNPL
jgi:hypothetical protein